MASAKRGDGHRSSTLLLLAANAVLAGFAWYASTVPIATEPVAPAVPKSVTDRASPSAGQTNAIPVPSDATKLTVTHERPLFRADRRRYEPNLPPTVIAAPTPAVTAPSISPPPPALQPTSISLPSDLRLVGIVAATGQRRAVFRKGAQRDSISVVAGDQVGDWRVVEISPESVVLVAGRQREVLDLFPTAKKVGTAIRQ